MLISRAMIATTTSSSMRVNPRSRRDALMACSPWSLGGRRLGPCGEGNMDEFGDQRRYDFVGAPTDAQRFFTKRGHGESSAARVGACRGSGPAFVRLRTAIVERTTGPTRACWGIEREAR